MIKEQITITNLHLINHCKNIKFAIGDVREICGGNVMEFLFNDGLDDAWKGVYGPKKLASCYDKALFIAKEIGLKSIAIPGVCNGGISTDSREETARITLHTIFAHIREGFDSVVTIYCYDENGLELYARCFWEESLTLIGDKSRIADFKYHIDSVTPFHWKERILGYFEDVEKNPDSYSGDHAEDAFGITPGYSLWTNHFENFLLDELDELAKVCWYGFVCWITLVQRGVHWGGWYMPNKELIFYLRAIQQHTDYITSYVRLFAIIEAFHRKGYEKVRICTYIATNGMAMRGSISTKKDTWKICGYVDGKTDEHIRFSGGLHSEELYKLTPDEVADYLLKKHEYIRVDGFGKDKEYVKWFQKAYNYVRKGYIPYSMDGYYNCLDYGTLALTGGTKRELPFPPPGNAKSGRDGMVKAVPKYK